MARKRRHFTPEEKIALVRKHLVEKVPISEICREHNLSPNLFYVWQRELFESGHVVFEPKKKKDRALTRLEAENAKLRDKLDRKNEVVAELMQEYIQLKKDLGEL